MSDQIPVGSPPVPPGRHAAPGGWYPDPTDPARERYWDGWQWSRQTREAAVASTPAGLPGAVGGAPQGGGAPVGRGPGTVAGWWQRAWAVLIDWLLLSVVLAALLAPIYLTISERVQPVLERMLDDARRGLPTSSPSVESLITQSEQFTIAGVTLLVSLVYHVLMLRWRGATLGKLAIGLRVVGLAAAPEATPAFGERLGWRTCVMRSMFWVIPGQSSCLWPLRIVDVLLPLRHPRRQALHDLVAATQVIRTR